MNWFTKWLMKENDVAKPIVEEVKVPLISEPVLSLIESLKNREWSFIYEEAVMSTGILVCSCLEITRIHLSLLQ